MSDHNYPVSIELLEHISATESTPVYCYAEDAIHERCQSVKKIFKGLPVQWLFAMKANDNPHILDIFRCERFGFDTVSYEEVLLGLNFVDDPANIFYTENNMTDAEMNGAIEAGVTLNIGSLTRLEAFCQHPDTRSCSIRINPNIGDGHHTKVITGNMDSKFGIRIDLLPDCLALAKKHGVRITGIHAHIGSGIQNPVNFKTAMEILLRIAADFPDLEAINFGGGIPVPYRPEDKEFSLADFSGLVEPLLKDDFKNRTRPITYFFEPGRWLIAQAGILLTRVNTVKDQGNKVFLGTDTGFNHLLRPALYDAYHHVSNISKPDSKAEKLYDVAGNICESGDILAFDRKLPETEIGDLLAFYDAGAYGMTMASHYNRRALPAEVLIFKDGNTKIIRPRKPASRQVEELFEETKFKKANVQ
ncbi:MAG: diaminopimelate decarboxylase [Balneolales bacterium]